MQSNGHTFDKLVCFSAKFSAKKDEKIQAKLLFVKKKIDYHGVSFVIKLKHISPKVKGER